MYFRVVDGMMRVGDTVRLINTSKEHQINELGVLAPKPVQVLQASYLPHVELFYIDNVHSEATSARVLPEKNLRHKIGRC